MSLDPPTYLSSLQNNIRARPIPWEGAVRAGTITESDLNKIRSVDKVRKEQRKQTVEADPAGFCALLLGGSGAQSVLESAGRRGDVVQYILVLAGDLIDDIPTFTTALLRHSDPYKPFVPLLTQSANPEDAIPLLASSVLTSLISHALTTISKPSPKTKEALPKLYAYLSILAKSSDTGLQDIAVQEYSALLRTTTSRELFWAQRQETVSPLIDILRAAAGKEADVATNGTSGMSVRSMNDSSGVAGGVGLQLLYHVLLVLWQLSFDGALVGEGLDEEYNLLPLYATLLRSSPKEKTTRLLLSTLHNLLSSNPSTLIPLAVLARLPSLLSNLRSRHLTDPDLLEDLNALTDLLNDYTTKRTTFDEYAAEVRSGHLRWSPPHRNDEFWRQNARKILDDMHGDLPKRLAEIASKAWENDPQVLAVACNDVACLVKEVPERRMQMEKAGLKARVMALMGHPDESVRWEALRAVGEWLRYSFDE
ncbi:MAG: hypothetical protein M1819_000148 [Sarea resinae]|nr:MAG: hypothetical protein M1819_000148 [Sarea resinae]